MYSKEPGEKSSHDLQGGPPVPCYPAASLLDRLCAAGKIDKIEMIWKDLRVFSPHKQPKSINICQDISCQDC